MLKFILWPILFLGLFFTPYSWAEEDTSKKVTKEIEEKHVYVWGIFDYLSVSNPSTGGSLSGPGLGGAVHYALYPKWALGLGARQTFSGTTGVATNFSFQVTWSPSGGLILYDEVIKDGFEIVATKKQQGTSGFRLQILASQYYFNSSVSTVPYSGLGLSGYYEHVTHGERGYIGGLKFEQISNQQAITPLSLFFAISFRL